MTVIPRLPLMYALVCALALAPSIADAAERVRWPIAWKAGDVASYDSESVIRETEDGTGGVVFSPHSESVVRETSDGAVSVRRVTDRTAIRTLEADDSGYALAWTTQNSRVEAVEGDRSMIDMLAPMLDELDGVEVVVELDRDGHYRRVRNLDAVVTKVRGAMLPVFAANLQRMFDVADPKLAKADHKALLTLARNNLEASIEGIVTTRSVEAMSSAQAKAITAFVGKPLVVGKRYRDDAPMESPREGRPLQASREYVLSLVDEDPALARIRWTRTLDPRGDAKMLWMLVDELVGEDAPAAREGRPGDLVFNEEGVVLFNRDTGVVEMLETIEISRYGKAHDEHERYRMRRVGSARTWAQEEAAAKR
jgi:hypothetical protein